MPRKKKSQIKKLFSYFSDRSSPVAQHSLSVIVAIACFFLSFFFFFVVFDFAGGLGSIVHEALFLSETSLTFFGWTFVFLPILLFGIGLHLIKHAEPMSQLRLWSASILSICSISVFFTVSFTEKAGGVLGNFLFEQLHASIGFFLYPLLLFSLLFSLFMFQLLSPIGIWEWVHGKIVEMKEDEEEEEYEDEEDYEEEEEYDEEEEEEYDEDEEEYEEDYEEEEEYDEEEEEEGGDEALAMSTSKVMTDYVAPPLSILAQEKGKGKASNTKAQAQSIKRTLKNFKVEVEIEEVTVGPTFTRYAVRPAEGVRLSKITGLQQNLELALAAHPIRIEAPIPGQSLVGIEVPNASRAVVGLRSLLGSSEFENVKGGLPLVIGKTITGEVYAKSLAKMPHALVAGTTGSGKSVLIHNLILSMLFQYGPRDLRFIFIDPKRVELTLYKGIPHMLTNPITNPKEALQALVWVVSEMERRYELLEDEGSRDLLSYNAKIKQDEDYLPYLVVIIDELADLMQNFPREIEANIVRIAQKSRAVGIHLILSTQRPSVNIITGVVKANIPVRIGLLVASNVDSRTILDTPGAENLTGNGDLLLSSSETKKPIRAQSAFVSEEEVKKVVSFIMQKNGLADGLIDIHKKEGGSVLDTSSDDEEDDLFPAARQVVIEAGKASTSLLQRRLKVGYSRAARLMDALEEQGVIGPAEGSKPREVLIEPEESEE